MPLISHPTRAARPQCETLAAWIRHWAAVAPERAAVIAADGRTLQSYGELAARCEILARGLAQFGIRSSDIIAMQLPNTADFIALYIAAGMCRAVVQTIHMSYRRADIAPLLRHSGAKIAVVESHSKGHRGAEELLKVQGQIPSLRAIVTVDGECVPHTMALDDLIAGATTAETELTPPHPDDTFVLLYTSGTTAQPKGVPATYRHFLTNARLSADALSLDADSRLLSAAPFTHLYGLFTIHMALYAGAAMVVLPSFAPAELTAALRLGRPTTLFAAPAHLAACLAQGLLDRDAVSSLRFAMTSGSLCPVSVATAMQDLMEGSFIQLWGMSELQAGTLARPEDPATTRLTTAGRASPGTELRVAAADGAVLPAGREGELQVRGPSVFAGYLNNPMANAMAFTADGWFRTGDLARLDGDGNLIITGRIKELINRGGIKINPTDTEFVLSRHPAVQQCALVPVPDDVLGERICCVLDVRPGQERPTLPGILDWLAQQGVSKIYWPERLEFVEAMPLTPTRKIIKGRLVETILRPATASAA